jgi:hypothetical protein
VVTGDALVGRDVARVERAVAAEFDAFEAASPRGKDSDEGGAEARDLVERSRGQEAERRAFAGREGCGVPACLA